MTAGIVDSNIIIHIHRNNQIARAWLAAQTVVHLVTSITWLEILDGVKRKATQVACETILNYFQLEHLTSADQNWAINQLSQKRLSQGIHVEDTLIASVAHRLQVPIYTHNVKDFLKLLPAELVIKPYTE